MLERFPLTIVAVALFWLINGAYAQQVSPSITDTGGAVGIGTSTPREKLEVSGNVISRGQNTHAFITVGSTSSARFGQDGLGAFVSSDTPGKSLRFLTTEGGGLVSWMKILPNGTVSITGTPGVHGEIAFAPDNVDKVRSFTQQADRQMHFRLSDSSGKDFLIAPYRYGMAIEYPGVLETWTGAFSVHNNHRNCVPENTNYLDPSSCKSGSQLWVGGPSDSGGLFMSSYDELLPAGTDGSVPYPYIDRSRSFSVIASDTFQHESHGDMLFVLRDANDSFRFQFGGSIASSGTKGQADDPNNYSLYTKARINSSGKGYFDGGTQTGGADFAESVSVEGQKMLYEPGDVLMISPDVSRHFRKTNESYSTLVAGIVSTKPGVLATTRTNGDQELGKEVPLALVGIVSCKVTTDNGAIFRGDLLVTSNKLGHAMKGSDKSRLTGAILGKAMEELTSGDGIIQVLVSLQ